MPDICRAVARTYSHSSHTADVEPINGLVALLASLPVLEPQDAQAVCDRDTVLILVWDGIGDIVIAAHA